MYDGRTQGSPLHVFGTYVNEEFIFRVFLSNYYMAIFPKSPQYGKWGHILIIALNFLAKSKSFTLREWGHVLIILLRNSLKITSPLLILFVLR